MVHKSITHFLFIPLLVSLLILQGCAISVTSTLQLVIAAAEAAIPVIDPAAASVAMPYLKAVSQAVSFASTELASADTSAVKAEKIITQFATIAAPNLPPGISQTIVSAVLAVTSAVGNFLATIQTAAPPAVAATAVRISGRAAPKPTAVPKQITVSAKDQQALLAIRARADALAAKIK